MNTTANTKSRTSFIQVSKQEETKQFKVIYVQRLKKSFYGLVVTITNYIWVLRLNPKKNNNRMSESKVGQWFTSPLGTCLKLQQLLHTFWTDNLQLTKNPALFVFFWISNLLTKRTHVYYYYLWIWYSFR